MGASTLTVTHCDWEYWQNKELSLLKQAQLTHAIVCVVIFSWNGLLYNGEQVSSCRESLGKQLGSIIQKWKSSATPKSVNSKRSPVIGRKWISRWSRPLFRLIRVHSSVLSVIRWVPDTGRWIIFANRISLLIELGGRPHPVPATGSIHRLQAVNSTGAEFLPERSARHSHLHAQVQRYRINETNQQNRNNVAQ